VKIVTILGARPQFIKAAAVSSELRRRREAGRELDEVILHTGQHFSSNMSDVFFEELALDRPAYNLGVGGGRHGAMTGKMLAGIEEVLTKEDPDWVLVYGDTNSTLAGAVAAAKLHLRIAHVEAGLRSFNTLMPEEVNRIVTDRLSALLFCPTNTAVENLQQEGVGNWRPAPRAVLTGDVMFDSALANAKRAIPPAGLTAATNFVLCTVHRAENTDNVGRLVEILAALRQVAKERSVVWPVHPRTKAAIQRNQIDTTGLTIIEPVAYLNMLWLLQQCDLVMTDSGGLQKEAYFHQKSCLVLRDETEWAELLGCGQTFLVGAEQERILQGVRLVSRATVQSSDHLFGSGHAAKAIAEELLQCRA
jgi:UDP-GlcNAc3NAcA epimerase